MALVAAASFLTEQRYPDYTGEQHAVWAELVRRRRPQIEAYACGAYLEGYRIIGLKRRPRCRTSSAISGAAEAEDGMEHHLL